MSFTIQASLAVGFLAIIPIAISLWLKKSFFWSIKGRHVVITGGSSDIGLWIAIRCVKLGAHVTLLGRNVKKLETAEEKIKLFRINDKQMIQSRTIDLAKNYDEVSSLLATLEDEIAPIYWLVNCAGGEMHSRHIDIFPDDAIYLMNVKYYAIYYPTRYVLSQMKKRGEGKITITGSQAKELVLEQYGHRPINFHIWKRASHGLADMVNAKDLNKHVSITLVLSDTDIHDVGHANYENDHNRVHIIYDRNAPKADDIANRIVCDSLNGKRISTLGWENWINLTIWKFSHLLQTILQRLRRFQRNKYSIGQVNSDAAPSVAQLPSEFIDCLSLQKDETEGEKDAADVPSNRNPNENSKTDDMPVEQLPSDELSSDVQNNLLVQQEVEPNQNGDDDQVEKAVATDSTGPSTLISDETFPVDVHSLPGSSGDASPTSTVDSNTNDFGGPTKRINSTGALFSFGTIYNKSTDSTTKNIEVMPSSSILAESNPGTDATHRNGSESSHQPETEQSNGQKIGLNAQHTFMFDSNSFATAKKRFSVDTSSTSKPNDQTGSSNVVSSTKAAHENVKPEKDLDALKKEILSLYGTKDDAFKVPVKISKDETTAAVPTSSSTGSIGMEMFASKVDKVKPSFSFNLPESNDLFANFDGVKPVTVPETGMKFSFNTSKESDAEKPFMFEAKSLENVSEKSTSRESINPKSKLPTRATIKRLK